MPQPSHVTALENADEATLPEDLQPYFQKCRDKLGFVPNVLRAWLLRPEKLRNFIRLYDELMLAPSGLTKLEREMIAVAVSAWNRCYYCLVAHGAAVRGLTRANAAVWPDFGGRLHRASDQNSAVARPAGRQARPA